VEFISSIQFIIPNIEGVCMKDDNLSSATKIHITSIAAAIVWAALSLAYLFGGLDRWASGYYFYDIGRFLIFLYDIGLAPVGAVCIAVKFLMYVMTDDGEKEIAKKVKIVQYEQSRIEGMVDKTRTQGHNAIVRIQDLEAKMEVICSILSLNKTDELNEPEDDVLGG
jgi:hypothetical protein